MDEEGCQYFTKEWEKTKESFLHDAMGEGSGIYFIIPLLNQQQLGLIISCCKMQGRPVVSNKWSFPDVLKIPGVIHLTPLELHRRMKDTNGISSAIDNAVTGIAACELDSELAVWMGGGTDDGKATSIADSSTVTCSVRYENQTDVIKQDLQKNPDDDSLSYSLHSSQRMLQQSSPISSALLTLKASDNCLYYPEGITASPFSSLERQHLSSIGEYASLIDALALSGTPLVGKTVSRHKPRLICAPLPTGDKSGKHPIESDVDTDMEVMVSNDQKSPRSRVLKQSIRRRRRNAFHGWGVAQKNARTDTSVQRNELLDRPISLPLSKASLKGFCSVCYSDLFLFESASGKKGGQKKSAANIEAVKNICDRLPLSKPEQYNSKVSVDNSNYIELEILLHKVPLSHYEASQRDSGYDYSENVDEDDDDWQPGDDEYAVASSKKRKASRTTRQPDTAYCGKGWGLELVRWHGEHITVRVGRVYPGSPADLVGLRTHDVIISLNGQDIDAIVHGSSLAKFLLCTASSSDPSKTGVFSVPSGSPQETINLLHAMESAAVGPIFVRIHRPNYPIASDKRSASEVVQVPTNDEPPESAPPLEPSQKVSAIPILGNTKKAQEDTVSRSHECCDSGVVAAKERTEQTSYHTQPSWHNQADLEQPSQKEVNDQNLSSIPPNVIAMAHSTSISSGVACSAQQPHREHLLASSPNAVLQSHDSSSRQTPLCQSGNRSLVMPDHLYAPGIKGTFITLLETSVLVEAWQRNFPALGIRLLCPRYDAEMLSEEWTQIIAPYANSYLSSIPKISNELWTSLLVSDYKRSLKETGPIIFTEGGFSYRIPKVTLPIDRLFEGILRKAGGTVHFQSYEHVPLNPYDSEQSDYGDPDQIDQHDHLLPPGTQQCTTTSTNAIIAGCKSQEGPVSSASDILPGVPASSLANTVSWGQQPASLNPSSVQHQDSNAPNTSENDPLFYWSGTVSPQQPHQRVKNPTLPQGVDRGSGADNSLDSSGIILHQSKARYGHDPSPVIPVKAATISSVESQHILQPAHQNLTYLETLQTGFDQTQQQTMLTSSLDRIRGGGNDNSVVTSYLDKSPIQTWKGRGVFFQCTVTQKDRRYPAKMVGIVLSANATTSMAIVHIFHISSNGFLPATISKEVPAKRLHVIVKGIPEYDLLSQWKQSRGLHLKSDNPQAPTESDDGEQRADVPSEKEPSGSIEGPENRNQTGVASASQTNTGSIESQKITILDASRLLIRRLSRFYHRPLGPLPDGRVVHWFRFVDEHFPDM